MKILLADDRALVRAGIRALLEHMPDVEVVGEAADGIEALALIKTTHGRNSWTAWASVTWLVW